MHSGNARMTSQRGKNEEEATYPRFVALVMILPRFTTYTSPKNNTSRITDRDSLGTRLSHDN